MDLRKIDEDGAFVDDDDIGGFEFSMASSAITEERLNLARSRTNFNASLDVKELATLREEQDRLDYQDIDLPSADAALDTSREEEERSAFFDNYKAAMYTANLKARSDMGHSVALGVVATGPRAARSSILYGDGDLAALRKQFSKKSIVDPTDVSYVRKPDLTNIISERDRLDPSKRPKYTLKQVLFSRRFHLYKHRFGNAQWDNTLVFPTLPQPKDEFGDLICGECAPASERDRTRKNGHRFIVAADTQFGILMDGFAMENPNWSQEIAISRKCVDQINAMEGEDRPLFVCVCGDLVDTESSFNNALASWKKVMRGWERNLIFEQQVKDFKRVWANLHPDIALVCLCGNHDVGNRPTKASIDRWTSSFGDDFFAFWVNGTYNIALNNCLFSDPTGAPDLYQEQLSWLEEKLAQGKAHNATHIFVYGHFPWFLRHEEEGDDELDSISAPPSGWGPEGEFDL